MAKNNITIQNMTKHNTKFIENWPSLGPGLQPWLSWQRCRWRLNSHLCRSHPHRQGPWSAPACHGPLPLLIQGWCWSLETTHGTDVTWCHMIRWSKLTPLLIQGWCWSLKTTHGTDVTWCHMIRWSKLTPLLIQGWCWSLKTTHGADVTWCHMIRWSKLTPLLIQGWNTWHWCHMIRSSKFPPRTHWLTDLLEEYCILPGNCPIKSPIKLKSDMFDTENSQFSWAQSPIPASGASSTNKTFHRDSWATFVTHSKNFVLACNFYVSLSYDNS